MCGVWLDIQIVYSSVPGLYSPMSPRVSIGFGMSRWLTSRWRTTTSAPSIAAAVPSRSPTDHSKTMLFGAFSWSCGAPGWVAFSASTTAGSGSQSTTIASRASNACSGVSAMTAATPSPVHLTLSVASARGVLTLFRMPAEPPAGQAIGSGLYGMSAPVITSRTPGMRLRRARVDRADVGVGVRAPEDRHVGHRLELDVVDEAAPAGDEALVLDALDALAEHVGGHLAPPQPAAPARTVARGRTDRGDDVLVAGAATEVALDRVPDLVVGRIRRARQQVGRRHDHPRRAEAALEAVVLPEGGLERVEPVRGGHPLDRRDRRAVRLDGEHRARLHGLAVHGHGARAALRGVAADVGPGQVQVLAEELDQEPSRLHVHLAGHSVDDERDMLGHGPTSFRQGHDDVRTRRGRCPGPVGCVATRAGGGGTGGPGEGDDDAPSAGPESSRARRRASPPRSSRRAELDAGRRPVSGASSGGRRGVAAGGRAPDVDRARVQPGRAASAAGRDASRTASPSRRSFRSAISQEQAGQAAGGGEAHAVPAAPVRRGRVPGRPQEQLGAVIARAGAGTSRRRRSLGRRARPGRAASCPGRR